MTLLTTVSTMTIDRPAPPSSDTEIAFADAFTEHAPRLLQYASRHVGPADAEDVLGETFCTAWRLRDKYDPKQGPLVGWLFGISANVLRHHKRSWLRGAAATSRVALDRHDAGDFADSVADRVDATRTHGSLAIELRALDERDRDVLLLSSWGQLTNSEIALALGIPLGTVRSRLHRARHRLLNALSSTVPTQPGDPHV